MTIRLNDFIRYAAIMLAFFGATVIALSSDSLIVHLTSIFFLTVVAIVQSGFNLSHPYFWFSSFFFLYNCAYMIILLIAPLDSAAKGYNAECGLLIVASLGTVLLMFPPHIYRYNYKSLLNPEKYKYDISLLSSLMWLFLFIQVITSLILCGTGVTSKATQWLEHNMYWILATYCTRFNTYIIAVLTFMGDNLKKKKLLLLCTFFATLFFSLLTGERDAILRLTIVLLLCLALIGKIRLRQLLIIVPAGITGMITLNYFKYYLSTGLMNRGTFALRNTLYEFLYSDFVDCGANLQVLTSYPELSGYKGFSVIFTDLLSSFIPTRFMNQIFGDVTMWNMSEWYNNYFYHGSTWSRAFTLVGEGYIIAGICGVVVISCLVGLLIRYLYKKSGKSPYYAAVYIYTAVTVISAFRGDMATIYVYLIRTPLFLLILIWFIKKILYHIQPKPFI